jgi:hypothetical protein
MSLLSLLSISFIINIPLIYQSNPTHILNKIINSLIAVPFYSLKPTRGLDALSHRNHNTVTSDRHPILYAPSPPAFDKEKLLAMQAQVLQGRMQSNTSSPYNMEMTKADVPTGLVKRQVAEAWNCQKNGTPELEIERQHKDIKTLGTCPCCLHYGHPCLQEDASLMIAEARQRYHSYINRDLSTQETVPKGVTQYQDGIQIMNLKDSIITVTVHVPVS